MGNRPLGKVQESIRFPAALERALQRNSDVADSANDGQRQDGIAPDAPPGTAHGHEHIGRKSQYRQRHEYAHRHRDRLNEIRDRRLQQVMRPDTAVKESCAKKAYQTESLAV